MILTSLLLGAALVVTALGAPAASSTEHAPVPDATIPPASDYDWSEGAVTEFPIHSSCNHTEVHQLRKALNDAVKLAEHASQHILRFGNESEHFQRYFGASPTAEVIGWFEKVSRGDRGRVLFRCDNPDGNCDLEDYGGHWRGENATDETVICPLSYETRNDLEQLCGLGYTVSGSETNFYFASDLLHRLYHMPAIGEGIVEHYSETFADVLNLPSENPANAVRNSDSLQYFALDVYAYDVAVPGEGCYGEGPSEESSATTAEPTSSQVLSTSSAEPTSSEGYATAAPSAASSATAEAVTVSTTSSAQGACHTHSDGVVHCE
ncbi:MAG: hypothetical protein M1837_005270 [Sclerophora amabilis]|nr:MAG: hypothetical protein M1837_005270 [Sclerophora amabilis]